MIEHFVEDESFEKINFSEKLLRIGMYENCTFSNCDFSNADLSDFKFIDTNFNDCNLSNANLEQTAFQDVR